MPPTCAPAAPWLQYFPGDFNSIFVPTVETTRLTYFLDSLVANKHHVRGCCACLLYLPAVPACCAWLLCLAAVPGCCAWLLCPAAVPCRCCIVHPARESALALYMT